MLLSLQRETQNARNLTTPGFTSFSPQPNCIYERDERDIIRGFLKPEEVFVFDVRLFTQHGGELCMTRNYASL
jgi:hypothetical protein